MATKSKTKNKEPSLFEIEFSVYQLEHCCGIGEVGGFRELSGGPQWWGGPADEPKFHTKKEQVDDLYKRIVEETWSARKDQYYSCLLITLISCYEAAKTKNSITPAHKKAGDAQFPELEEKLLEEGWIISQVFINPNHGNEVTMYTKYFPDRDKDPYEDEYDEDEF
jgi:hypothetical protein